MATKVLVVHPPTRHPTPCRLVPGALVVKGLNTLSAWVLLNGPLAGKQVRKEQRQEIYKNMLPFPFLQTVFL